MLIASLTTIPERLDAGLPARCIRSLLAQSRRPDVVLVNIPRVSRRGIAYDTARAMALSELAPDVVVVNWVSRDWGPMTKLLGALEYLELEASRAGISPGRARLFLADDDIVYDPRSVLHLLDTAEQANLRAVGYVSRDPVLFHGNIHDTVWRSHKDCLEEAPVQVAVLESYAGALYDASLFGHVSNLRAWMESLPANCWLADDILIGAWVHRMGIVPMRCPPLAPGVDSCTSDAAGTPQLRDLNLGRGANNERVFQYLFDRLEFARWQSFLSTVRAAFVRLSEARNATGWYVAVTAGYVSLVLVVVLIWFLIRHGCN